VYEEYAPQVDLFLSFFNDDTAEGLALSTGIVDADDGDILDSGASATIVQDRSRHVTFNPDDTVDIGGADSASGRFRTVGAGQLDLVTVDDNGKAAIVSLPRSHVSNRVRRNLICLGHLVDAGYKFDLAKEDSVMYSSNGVKIPLYFDHNHMLILPRHVNSHLPFPTKHSVFYNATRKQLYTAITHYVHCLFNHSKNVAAIRKTLDFVTGLSFNGKIIKKEYILSACSCAQCDTSNIRKAPMRQKGRHLQFTADVSAPP
jgi:hypothetical protein